MRSPKLLGTVLSMNPSTCSLRGSHCIVNPFPSKTCLSYNPFICSPVLISSSVHATINPSLLNPASHDGQPIRSKLVDFAIVLRPNEKLASALPLTGSYTDGGVQSFNHTRYGPLTNKPIVPALERNQAARAYRKPRYSSLCGLQLTSAVCATC
jgi:hypothetical protein